LRELIMKENWWGKKGINNLHKEMENKWKEKDKEAALERGEKGVIFDYRTPDGRRLGKPGINVDSKGKPRPQRVGYVSMQDVLNEWLRREGRPEIEPEFIKKVENYIEPDITSKQFLESEGKINPEMYNTNLLIICHLRLVLLKASYGIL
jgi:rhodanese-related sulfurtransferase